MLEKTVKKYSKQQGLTLKELAEKIDMSEAGLHRALRTKSLKVKTLERLSDVLQVPASTLLGEEEKVSERSLPYSKNKERLEERLRSLENEIDQIRRSIE